MTRKSERLYNIYTNIKYRVRHKGFSICNEWEIDYEEFKKWSNDNGYSSDKNLFLKKVSDGYFPANCEWALSVREVRIPNGRTKYFCIDCDVNQVSRKNIRCKTCNGLHSRIYPDYDKYSYRRNWSLLKKYDISLEEFNKIFELQSGKCLICSKLMKLPEKKQGQSMDVVAVDHCHVTGKVRGLLCNACNKGLGHFEDSIELLSNAIKYIENSEGK